MVASHRKEIKYSRFAVWVAMPCIMYLVDVKIIAGLLPPSYRVLKVLLRLPLNHVFHMPDFNQNFSDFTADLRFDGVEEPRSNSA